MVPRRVVLISYDTIYCAQVLPGVIEKHVEIEMRMVKKQMLEILMPALWACFSSTLYGTLAQGNTMPHVLGQ
mgnify:CR=1 FL=1